MGLGKTLSTNHLQLPGSIAYSCLITNALQADVTTFEGGVSPLAADLTAFTDSIQATDMATLDAALGQVRVSRVEPC